MNRRTKLAAKIASLPLAFAAVLGGTLAADVATAAPAQAASNCYHSSHRHTATRWLYQGHYTMADASHWNMYAYYWLIDGEWVFQRTIHSDCTVRYT